MNPSGPRIDKPDGTQLRESKERRKIDIQARQINEASILDTTLSSRDSRLPPNFLEWRGSILPQIHQPSLSAFLTKFPFKYRNMDKPKMCAASFCPDARFLLAGHKNGSITLWSVSDFRYIFHLDHHPAAITTMKWLPNRSLMISGDAAGKVNYYNHNLAEEKRAKVVQLHEDSLAELAINATGQKMASCGKDRQLVISDIANLRHNIRLAGHSNELLTCDWHPYSSLILSGSKDLTKAALLWDARQEKAIFSLKNHSRAVEKVRWHKNGRNFVTCCDDGLLRSFDLRNIYEPLQNIFLGEKNYPICGEFHPIFDDLLAIGAKNGDVFYVNADFTKPFSRELGLNISSQSVFSQKSWGKAMASDRHPAIITSIHEQTNQYAHVQLSKASDRQPFAQVNDLCWSPCGNLLATVGDDHYGKVWTYNLLGVDDDPDKFSV